MVSEPLHQPGLCFQHVSIKGKCFPDNQLEIYNFHLSLIVIDILNISTFLSKTSKRHNQKLISIFNVILDLCTHFKIELL